MESLNRENFYVLMIIILLTQFQETEAASLQQVVNIVLLLRDVMKTSFPLDTINTSVRRRLKRAENDMKCKTAFTDTNTPRPMSDRKHKGRLLNLCLITFN